LATYQQLTRVSLRIRALRRVALDTPYTSLAHSVASLIAKPPFADNTSLVVDATGVGRPVVDFLKAARPPCRLLPVVITGPGQATQSNGVFHVPRQDLIANLQILIETRELSVARTATHADSLEIELSQFSRRRTARDDLVFATALASWAAIKRY